MGCIAGEGIILLEFYSNEVFLVVILFSSLEIQTVDEFIDQAAFSIMIPSFFFSSLLWILLSVSDRLSTGIVVADIDLSLVDSVREKMPIAKVIICNVYIHPTNTREWNGI